MKIAVCDDNHNDRLIIKQWFSANRPEINMNEIIEFSSGEELLRYLWKNPLDIIFLDCQMDGLDGISTTKKVRTDKGDIIVILVSNYAEYAVHGYELNVFRYIMKHDFQAKAGEVFEKAALRLEQKIKKAYWLTAWGKSEKIDVDDISYIESRRNKIYIMLTNKSSHSQYTKLDSIEENLKDCGFIRCHQSYLVNSRYVRRIEKNAIVLENGGSVPISRDMHKFVYDTLAVWISEGG
jgi:DNA-binding LytR/AlgR family response regulator